MDGSAALTDTKSPNHHNGQSTLHTTGGQPKNWRATIPRTGGRRPENRHDRYASRNAGDVHHGTGDPGELRCDSETAARASSLEQTIPSFRLYEQAGRCSKTRGMRWPALKADSTTTRHMWTDPAQRTLTVDKNVSQA